MSWMPFICLGSGLLLGCLSLPEKFVALVDKIVNVALILLMVVIGMNVGVNDSVMKNLPRIGVNCALMCLAAIFGSVILTVLLEKTIVPLDKLATLIASGDSGAGDVGVPDGSDENGGSALLWIIPAGVIGGIGIGFFLLGPGNEGLLNVLLYGSLIVLYTGVGIGMGNNRGVFKYLKALGFKVVLLALAVFFGSVGGGVLAGTLAGVPLEICLIAPSGMGYYSMTGAFMTQNLGAEAGIYGFMVNVMRDFFTVLLLPILIRISKGSAVASGAGGNMDTMLVPIVKFLGQEIGLVAMVVGIITTFSVPFIQPMLLAWVK